MIPRFLFGLVFLTATGCSRENALELPITQHCSVFAAEVDQMARDYEARSKIDDSSLSADQLQAADAKSGIVPLDRRYVIVAQLARDLGFCEVVRRQDESASHALDTRTAAAFKAFVDATKLSDAAKALHDLSAIALEVSHLPLK